MLSAIFFQADKAIIEVNKMSEWLAENFNIGTLAVLAVLLVLCGLIIRKLVLDKRAGRLSCGGNCGACGACKGGSCSTCASIGAADEDAIKNAIKMAKM